MRAPFLSFYTYGFSIFLVLPPAFCPLLTTSSVSLDRSTRPRKNNRSVPPNRSPTERLQHGRFTLDDPDERGRLLKTPAPIIIVKFCGFPRLWHVVLSLSIIDNLFFQPDAAGGEDFMAGSQRSPGLKDQWRGSGDAGDQPGRERHRPRGSYRDRGRDRFRDRERRRWSKSDRSPRSPPPRSYLDPDNEPRYREFSTNNASTRGSPGPSHSEIRPNQKSNRLHSPEPFDHRGPDSLMRSDDRDYRREDSPSAPPSKRKRTRSPSPGSFHSRPPTHPRGAHPRHGHDFDRGKRRGGRMPGRGRPSRRPSPRRGRDRRKHEGGPRDSSRRRHSRSPGWDDKPYTHPSRRFPSPRADDEVERGSYHRSPSRNSAGTLDSRPSAFSRRGSKGDTAMYPPASPFRENPDPAADTTRASGQRRRSRSPANSYHGSTRSNSPFSSTRGGRNGQHSSHHGLHRYDIIFPTYRPFYKNHTNTWIQTK